MNEFEERDEEPQPFVDISSEKQEKTKEKKKRDDTKNFLINFRSFFVDYIKLHDATSTEDPYIQELEKKKNMNRSDYEELFKNQRYKKLISQMF